MASLTKQKLFQQVDELFRELIALKRPERVVDKKKVKKKVYKTQEKAFFDEIEAWIKQVREFMQLSKLRWCDIFYLRMQHNKDSIKADQVQAFEALMRWYDKQWSDPAKNPLADTVASFERFLVTHTMDPDGCLVGMTPDSSILSKFSFYLENQNQQIDYEAEACQENLAKNIVAWSKIDDLDHLAREVRTPLLHTTLFFHLFFLLLHLLLPLPSPGLNHDVLPLSVSVCMSVCWSSLSFSSSVLFLLCFRSVAWLPS